MKAPKFCEWISMREQAPAQGSVSATPTNPVAGTSNATSPKGSKNPKVRDFFVKAIKNSGGRPLDRKKIIDDASRDRSLSPQDLISINSEMGG